ncbi:MAG: TauD/TfdA family dioxygenase [Alphaproteobacteria bacterium]|nr:TauD/TfdA family dioxygenase [Alphaproteobacteria bacterium]MCY4231190.1 TauD/TfdA family dioxygenase [Alphaproteobacteria bacterium]
MQIVAFDAPLGAELRGLDASRPVGAADAKALRRALDDHLVLLARDQKLDDPALLGFSRVFGELDPPGPNPYGGPFLSAFPEINVISNVVEDGRPIGNLGAGEAVWHADMTYMEKPPKAALLHALEVPEGQGDTYFANQFVAWQALPIALRRRIEGLYCVHDSAHNSAGMLRRGHRKTLDVRKTPGARQPLVRTDPATGARALFLGRRPHAWIVGLDVGESDALLDRLWAHASDPRFVWRHRWQPGDLLVWNNLGVLHRRDAFDASARRVMHRTQIRGKQKIA